MVLAAGSDREAAVREAFTDPAIGRLQERTGTGVFEAHLQAQRGGSVECLPSGRRAVAPRTFRLIFSVNF